MAVRRHRRAWVGGASPIHRGASTCERTTHTDVRLQRVRFQMRFTRFTRARITSGELRAALDRQIHVVMAPRYLSGFIILRTLAPRAMESMTPLAA